MCIRDSAETLQLVFQIGDTLAGETGIFALFAASPLITVAGGTGTVDFLAFFEVDRNSRAGNKPGGSCEQIQSAKTHAEEPRKTMRQIVARHPLQKIDANHA